MSKSTKPRTLSEKYLVNNPDKFIVSVRDGCKKHTVVTTFADLMKSKSTDDTCPVCDALKTIKTKKAFQKYCDKVMPTCFDVKEFNGIDEPTKIFGRNNGWELCAVNAKKPKVPVTPRQFIDESHYPLHISEKRWIAELLR